ncbi:MAG TPA: hypothetical protein P5154_01845 [Candidatus Izemoplasmatales bacterium]|nr:hypothetical protein [Bacillota bacterium]HRY77488.1 hypothetical protein [Candidatus Izemoplasmatales bacterium]
MKAMEKDNRIFHALPLSFHQAFLRAFLLGSLGGAVVMIAGLFDPNFVSQAHFGAYFLVAGVPYVWSFLRVFLANFRQKGLTWIIDDDGIEIHRPNRPIARLASKDLILVEVKTEWLPRRKGATVSIVWIFGEKLPGHWFVRGYRLVIAQEQKDLLLQPLEAWLEAKNSAWSESDSEKPDG